MEKTDIQNAYNINKNVFFVPKKEDPLDVVIDIIDESIEHKKKDAAICPSPSKNCR